MKMHRKIALLIAALLLLGFCQTAYAAEDSEDGVEIFVCETTAVYDASGEEIGRLSPGEPGEYVSYQSGEDGVENTAHVFLQRSAVDQNAEEGQAGLTGKCEVKIVWTAGEPETSIENADESVETDSATLDESENETSGDQDADSTFAETGWIDSGAVIDALIQTDTDRVEEVAMLEGKTEALQTKIDLLTAELQAKDTVTETAEDEAALANREPVLDAPTLIVLIVACVFATLLIACFVWLIFEHRTAGAKASEKLKQIPEEADRAKAPTEVNLTTTVRFESPEESPILLIRLDNANGNGTAVRPDRIPLQTKGDTDEKSNRKPKGSEPEPPNEEQLKKKRREEERLKEEQLKKKQEEERLKEERIRKENYQSALDLVNQLSDIVANDLWQEKIKKAGFEYALLDPTEDRKPAFKKAQADTSIYAAIWRQGSSATAYLVPSFNDANARRRNWAEFYKIEDRNGEKQGYQILKFTELSHREAFYHVEKDGKMIRNTCEGD